MKKNSLITTFIALLFISPCALAMKQNNLFPSANQDQYFKNMFPKATPIAIQPIINTNNYITPVNNITIPILQYVPTKNEYVYQTIPPIANHSNYTTYSATPDLNSYMSNYPCAPNYYAHVAPIPNNSQHGHNSFHTSSYHTTHCNHTYCRQMGTNTFTFKVNDEKVGNKRKRSDEYGDPSDEDDLPKKKSKRNIISGRKYEENLADQFAVLQSLTNTTTRLEALRTAIKEIQMSRSGCDVTNNGVFYPIPPTNKPTYTIPPTSEPAYILQTIVPILPNTNETK